MKNKRKLIQFTRKLYKLFMEERKKRLTDKHQIYTMDEQGNKGSVEYIDGIKYTSILITLKINKELLK